MRLGLTWKTTIKKCREKIAILIWRILHLRNLRKRIAILSQGVINLKKLKRKLGKIAFSTKCGGKSSCQRKYRKMINLTLIIKETMKEYSKLKKS